MKICCISDTHGYPLPEIPPDTDLIIHAGDMENTLNKVGIYKKVVSVWGNHDAQPANSDPVLDCFTDPVRKIFVSPHSHFPTDIKINPRYAHFMHTEEVLKTIYAAIPDDTEILVTHGPAFGILDTTSDGRSTGSTALLDRLAKLTKLKLHVFGHIHEAYGIKDLGRFIAVNASICNADYKPVNKPIMVEIN